VSAWFLKFFSGFSFWTGQFWGKMIYFAIIFLVFMTVYTKLTAATTVQTITSENVTIEAESKRVFFLGVKLWRVRLGIAYE